MIGCLFWIMKSLHANFKFCRFLRKFKRPWQRELQVLVLFWMISLWWGYIIMNLALNKNSPLGRIAGDVRGCGRGTPWMSIHPSYLRYLFLNLEKNAPPYHPPPPPPLSKTLCPGCSNSDSTIQQINHHPLSCLTVIAMFESNNKLYRNSYWIWTANYSINWKKFNNCDGNVQG